MVPVFEVAAPTARIGLGALFFPPLAKGRISGSIGKVFSFFEEVEVNGESHGVEAVGNANSEVCESTGFFG